MVCLTHFFVFLCRAGEIASEKIIQMLSHELRVYLRQIVESIIDEIRKLSSVQLPYHVKFDIVRRVLTEKETALLDQYVADLQTFKVFRAFKNYASGEEEEDPMDECETQQEAEALVGNFSEMDSSITEESSAADNHTSENQQINQDSSWDMDRVVRRKAKYQKRLAEVTTRALTPQEYIKFVNILTRCTIRMSVDTNGRQFLRNYCSLDESILWMPLKIMQALFALATEHLRTVVRRACDAADADTARSRSSVFDGFSRIAFQDMSYAVRACRERRKEQLEDKIAKAEGRYVPRPKTPRPPPRPVTPVVVKPAAVEAPVAEAPVAAAPVAVAKKEPSSPKASEPATLPECATPHLPQSLSPSPLPAPVQSGADCSAPSPPMSEQAPSPPTPAPAPKKLILKFKVGGTPKPT
jgi:hypothetical protein